MYTYRLGCVCTNFLSFRRLVFFILLFLLFDGFVSWFRSCFTNRISHVLYCGAPSPPYEASRGVPQRSVLGPLLFNIVINDMCGVVSYSNCRFFADDINVFREIKSLHDSLSLQSDINRFRRWCIANSTKLNANKTRVISSRKPKLLGFRYKLYESSTTRTGCIKDLGVLTDSKLHSHHHVDYIFSQTGCWR